MKIVIIFDQKLYSFAYKKDDGTYYDNEYDRLMDLWTCVSYLKAYAEDNNVQDVGRFVRDRLRDAENIQDLLDELVENEEPLEYYFQPLRNEEMGPRVLSIQKGKVSKRDGLRLYAVKIDEDCFVITGGAIKMSQAMQDHPDSNTELGKLKKAQEYLKEQGVLDEDSFYEFKDE